MIVRRAEEKDIPVMLKMARSFFEETSFPAIMEFDEATVKTVLDTALTHEDYGFFLAEDDKVVGMAAGLLYPFYFNANHLTGQELMWWVEPSTRGQRAGMLLYKALMEWASSRADSFSMGALDSVNPEKVEQFYLRQGFRPSERNYIKKFGD